MYFEWYTFRMLKLNKYMVNPTKWIELVKYSTVVVSAFTGIADYEAPHQALVLVSNSENMECVLGTQSCLFLRPRPRFIF